MLLFLPLPQPLQPAPGPLTVSAVFFAEGFLHRLLLGRHVADRHQKDKGRNHCPRSNAAQKHGQADQRSDHTQIHRVTRESVRSTDDKAGRSLAWFDSGTRPLEELVRPDVQRQASQDERCSKITVGRWNHLVHWYQEVQQEHGHGCHEEPSRWKEGFQLHNVTLLWLTMVIPMAQFTSLDGGCKIDACIRGRLPSLAALYTKPIAMPKGQDPQSGPSPSRARGKVGENEPRVTWPA